MIESKPTIFCDIDGTLVKHAKPNETCTYDHKLTLLDGTIDKLLEWEKKGYRIILTTGRKETSRVVTEKQLADAGIFYDLLIMNIGGGPRYLINDKKQDGDITSFAYCPDRNYGIKDINI